MKRNREIVYPLQEGMDQYSPDISAQGLPLVELSNAVVRKRRLDTLQKHSQVGQVGTSPVLGYIHSFDPTTAASAFYALTDTGVYRYDAESDEWFPEPIDTFVSTGQPFASVQWEDRVYVTRPGYPLSKLDYHQSVEVDTSWREGTQSLSARYALVTNNHLMLANVQEGQSSYRTRLQWSDLYRPEQWRIRTDTEADLFDVDVGTAEITGITMQRGYVVIYTQNSIWRGTYRGLPQIYFFEPVINGLGNIFHYSVVQVKEVDFFVGRDNFYVQDGLQPRAIGDPVWAFFKRTAVTTTAGSQLRGFADEDNNEVFWQYERTGSSLGQELSERWELVYNYKEQQWGTRSAQGAQTYYFPFRDIRTYRVIDEFGDDQIEGWYGFRNGVDLPLDEGSGLLMRNTKALDGAGFFMNPDPDGEYTWIVNGPGEPTPFHLQLFPLGRWGMLRGEDEIPTGWTRLDVTLRFAMADGMPAADLLHFFSTVGTEFKLEIRRADNSVWVHSHTSAESGIRADLADLTSGWHTIALTFWGGSGALEVFIDGQYSFTVDDLFVGLRNELLEVFLADGNNSPKIGKFTLGFSPALPPDVTVDPAYLIDGGDYSGELIDGGFQYTNVPQQPWVGGLAGQVYTQSSERTLPDGSAAHGFFETFEVFFDSTFSSKELSRVKVSYKGEGAPNVELLIGTRSNQMEAVKWSDPIKPSGLGGVLADTTFDFRADAEGKYIRFKVRWENTAEDFISEFYSVSPELTTPIGHDTR